MAGTHQRNTGPMLASPRCGARTRSGAPCQSPQVTGAARCRMHGGRGSGAPMGNSNALKNGLYTAEMRAHVAEVRVLLNHAEAVIARIEAQDQADRSGRAPDGLAFE
jgi:hypothetical protein